MVVTSQICNPIIVGERAIIGLLGSAKIQKK
jgi:hypothetical protein